MRRQPGQLPSGREPGDAAAMGRGGGILPAGAAAGPRPARNQDRARAGDAVGGHGPRPEGPYLRGAGPARRSAARIPPGQRVRSVEPVDCRASRRTRPRAARAARGDAAASGDRADARAGAAQHPGADAQPVVARSAQPALRQHQPARPAQLHRQRDRHQRHLRPRLPGPQRHRSARGRHARTGAAAGDGLEPDLLQGDERADDHRRHRQHRQAAAVPRNRSSRRSSCRTPTPPSWRSWSTP